MLYDGELDHQHQNLENEVTNTRRDLLGTNARLVEVDHELGAVRADLSTARHAIVELDDALTALRAEHADFKQHAAANLASLNELAAELTAEVAKDPEFTKMVVGLLRALTFNLGGYEFRGETRPGDWDPDAEYARMAGETEADKPVPAAAARRCSLDTVEDCPNPVVWRWWPNGRPGESVWLCDGHAAGIDLSDLEDLTSIEASR